MLADLKCEFLLVLIDDVKDTVKSSGGNAGKLLIIIAYHRVGLAGTSLAVGEDTNVVSIHRRLD